MKLKKGFMDINFKNKFSLYGDTDSSYTLVVLPFSKFKDLNQLVNFSQKVSKDFNKHFLKCFNDNIVKYGNVDPKYNLMFFKSEIIAHRAFFLTKKFYGMAKVYDEGTIFDTPKIKKTGGQIVKADTTFTTAALLKDVYDTILLNMEITEKEILKQKIFKDIKSKYINKLDQDVMILNFESFGIPKKWGMRPNKTLPKTVMGAFLYNFLFKDVIRPGDSVYMFQIKINVHLLIKSFENHKGTLNKFQLSKDLINEKLNVISIPVDLNNKEKNDIITTFKKLFIELDRDSIIEFNIEKKIEQFAKMF